MLRALIIALLFTAGLHAQTVKTHITSTQLLPGEVTALRISVQGAKLSQQAQITLPNGLSLKYSGASNSSSGGFFSQNRVVETTLSYELTGVREGTYTIPSTQLPGTDLQTDAITVTVHPRSTDQVIWREGQIRQQGFTFGLATFMPVKNPYVGQVIPTELKIYIPNGLQYNANTLPEVELDGLNAHRFNPEETSGYYRTGNSVYRVVTFRSIVSALRPGPVKLGPATIEIPVAARTFNSRSTLKATFPEREMDARALPAGAPEGYSGAIGQFEMTGSIDLSEAEPGGPFAVSLSISGTGNLDVIHPPELESPQNWKSYPPRRVDGADIRHEGRGTVDFDLLLRPLKNVNEIPPFVFSYFDPITEKYETLVSESNQLPQNLQELPNAVATAVVASGSVLPPAAVNQPIEEMTQTLGLVDPLRNPQAPVWPPRHRSEKIALWWHIIPASLVIALVVPVILRRRQERLSASHQLLPRHKEQLAELGSSSLGLKEFYRKAGKLIESSPVSSSPELQAILERRDELCFQSDENTTDIGSDERRSTIEAIKNALLSSKLLVLLLTCLLTSPALEATSFAEVTAAFQKGNYEKIITLYQEQASEGHLTADELYNIGVAYARDAQTGRASLYFRRALALDPSHPESLQNLRFLERKSGSLTPARAGWAESLTALPRTTYVFAGQACLWLIAAAVTFTICYRRYTGLCFGIVLVTFTLAIASFTSAFFYPDYGDFRADNSLAVVTATTASAVTDPSKTAKTVISTPPGSLCKILTTRGKWTYCEFPQGTRGWLSNDSLSSILPASEQK